MSIPNNLGEILRLPLQGDSLAFVDLRDPDAPRSYTANQLEACIRSACVSLIERGIRAGDRIAVLSENRAEFLMTLFGAMRVGAVAVPVNHKLPMAVVAHIFRDSKVRIAFADAARRAMVPDDIETIGFDDDSPAGFRSFIGGARAGQVSTFEPAPGDLAEILYTSGSTGRPKGVPLTHAGQLWAVSRFFAPLDSQTAADRTIVAAPLYHMNGLFFTMVALANRMAIVSLPRFNARRYLEAVARYRCSVLSGIPTMFALMVREPDLLATLDLSSVREISIGSAPLTDALLDQVAKVFPRARVKNGYGTTEAGPAVFGPHPKGLATPALSLGYPIEGVQWRLQGSSPEEGVLELRTPALMSGYLNLAETTRQRVRDGWYDTGDVMRRDANGFFHFVGRNDDMFVCGGENIYPGEVEKLLERHPDVAQAAVVPAPDDIKGAIPVAFVVLATHAVPSSTSIKQFALQHGPAYAHPRFVVFRNELPMSGTHKIDRSALTAEAAHIAKEAGRAS
jgi:acyl-CoA synthetase (AMP-forming)/AMP-acid ligase II